MTNACTFVTKNPCIVTPKCSIICHSITFPVGFHLLLLLALQY